MSVLFKPAEIGRAIYYILSTASSIVDYNDMSSQHIQPAPMKAKGNPTAGITYEVTSISPINTKRLVRTEAPPVYNVTFTLEVFHTNYVNCVNIAYKVVNVFNMIGGTFNGITIQNFALDNMTEAYNKEKRYYTKLISFDCRVLC